MNANHFDGPNPFQSPEIIQAELNEPRPSQTPVEHHPLSTFPAAACAFLVISGLFSAIGWYSFLFEPGRDPVTFAMAAGSGLLSFVLSFRLLRWAIAGV